MNTHSLQSYLQRITFLGCVACALSGCGSRNGDLEWSEEVKLSSGPVIMVKRSVKGKAVGEWGGPGGWQSLKQTIDVVSDTNPVPAPPRWSEPRVPMILDYDTNRRDWLLVATFYTCEEWWSLGRPPLPYLVWRARNGMWERVALSEELFGRPANLLTGPSGRGEPTLVRLPYKESENRDAAEKYRSVLREWHSAC